MKDFPYERVYNYFAHPMALAEQLPPGMLAPSLVIVRIGDNDEIIVTPLPDKDVQKFFEGPGGTAALGEFIRTVVPVMGDEPVSLVLMTEAYYLVKSNEEEALKAQGKGRLSENPESQECVIIRIYRPEGVRFGMLPILPGRKVQYSPMYDSGTETSGNLAMNPDRKNAH